MLPRTSVNTPLTIASAVVLTAALVSGCARGNNNAGDRGSTITVLYEGDDFLLGPAGDDSPKFLVFLPLVRGYGAEAQPSLAERWEHSRDYTTWTYHLRRDIRWHDGVPVTAHDIAFSIQLFAHPDVLFAQNQIVGAEAMALDDSTLQITWQDPTGPAEALSGWTVYYPKHLLEGLDPQDFYTWEFWTHPIGNGPYRYVRHVPQTMIQLEANPDYYAGPPAIERVVLKLSTASRVIELTSGNADVAYYVPPVDVLKLRADPEFQVYHLFAFSEPQAIHWNQRHPLLADSRVRQALSHAIDRRELSRVNSLPDEMPLVGGLSPEDRSARLYREGKLDPGPSYDPTAARRLLDEAGWVDRNGDGVRERNGVAARFTMIVRQGGLSAVESALFIQDQLRRVGIRMEIRPVERSVWFNIYRAADFDATIWDVPNVPQWLLDRDFFGAGTRIGYRNPEIVQLLETLTTELDPTVQDTLYAQINEMLRRDIPVTFLFPYVESIVAHRRIQGMRTPERANLLSYIADLWIEEDRR